MPPTLLEIEQLATQLPIDEQRALVEHLQARLSVVSTGTAPETLQDMWKGKVPDDFDVDAALRGIRSQWLEDTGDVAP